MEKSKSRPSEDLHHHFHISASRIFSVAQSAHTTPPVLKPFQNHHSYNDFELRDIRRVGNAPEYQSRHLSIPPYIYSGDHDTRQPARQGEGEESEGAGCSGTDFPSQRFRLRITPR